MAMGKDKSKVNQANVEQSGPLSHKEILIVLSGLMTGMLLAALDQTIVSTALKNIVEDFNGLNHYCVLINFNCFNTFIWKNLRSIWQTSCISVCNHYFSNWIILSWRIPKHDAVNLH